MKTKRLLACLLTLIMVMSCLSVAAFAETDPVELTVGENPVVVPAGEEDYFRTVYFTPELSGYYLIDVDWEEPAMCWVDAETISDGEYDYYVLEAGVTYEVTVANLDEVEAEYIVCIEYFEDLEILLPVSIELVDSTPVTYIENSCGVDMSALGLDIGWYYLPLMGLDREVVITFSDGSTATGVPGDEINGFEIEVADSQTEAPWSEGDAYIEYSYMDLSVQLQVEFAESPVENVELRTAPTNSTLMMDEEFNMVNADGEIIETIGQLLEGMSLKVNYKDGSSKTVAADDIDWVNYEGLDVPFVDGYPVDILSAFLGMLEEDAEPPCDIELTLGYMGADFSYTLSIVEEFPEEPPVEDEPEKPDVEQIPETGDAMTAMVVLVAALAVMGVALIGKKKMM